LTTDSKALPVLPKKQPSDHRFLDEAGDTTFFGKGRIPILGMDGVSKTFIIGMAKFREPLAELRKKVLELQAQVASDPYYSEVPSIQKKINNSKGFYFHCNIDPPEVRKGFYEFIRTIDCSFEAIVARKIIAIFEKKHHGKETEFYADVLSHLLKNKLNLGNTLVLDIAERGSSTKNSNLEIALNKAVTRYLERYPSKPVSTKVVFNIQNHHTEPLLNIADYFCWAIQRVFEKGETRYYDFLKEKISLVVDIYDTEKWERSRNYYTPKNPLTAQNKISPLVH
jgi:hypothetical protein